MKHSHHIRPEIDESPALRTLLDIRAVQLLLAGVYFVLGCVLNRCERAAHRERAWRVRRAITDTRRREVQLLINAHLIEDWSGDDSLHWEKRMYAIWHYNEADHPPKYRRIGGRIEKFVESISKLSHEGLRAFVNLRDSLRVPAPP